MWNGRACWLGKEIMRILKYSNTSKTLNECIKEQYFEEDIEYKKLRGNELLEFRRIADSICPGVISIKTRNLIILFESGLYGTLQYTKKPEGVVFGLWIRREVVSEIMKKGYYVFGDDYKSKKEVMEIEQKVSEEKEVVIKSIKKENEELWNFEVVANMMSIYERAVNEGGILLEGISQLLDKAGIDVNNKK
ncbi:MAG: BRO family protein [Sarcina sp.]